MILWPINRAWRLALVLGVFAGACTTSGSELPVLEMKLKGQTLKLEVAATREERSRGLMYRDALATDHGMLFVFEEADRHAFWMHHTRIPLDVIWLDEKAKVVHIATLNAYDETSVGPPTPAKFVIEVNAGWAAKWKLEVGETLELPEKVIKVAAATRPADR